MSRAIVIDVLVDDIAWKVLRYLAIVLIVIAQIQH